MVTKGLKWPPETGAPAKMNKAIPALLASAAYSVEAKGEMPYAVRPDAIPPKSAVIKQVP